MIGPSIGSTPIGGYFKDAEPEVNYTLSCAPGSYSQSASTDIQYHIGGLRIHKVLKAYSLNNRDLQAEYNPERIRKYRLQTTF